MWVNHQLNVIVIITLFTCLVISGIKDGDYSASPSNSLCPLSFIASFNNYVNLIQSNANAGKSLLCTQTSHASLLFFLSPPLDSCPSLDNLNKFNRCNHHHRHLYRVYPVVLSRPFSATGLATVFLFTCGHQLLVIPYAILTLLTEYLAHCVCNESPFAGRGKRGLRRNKRARVSRTLGRRGPLLPFSE